MDLFDAQVIIASLEKRKIEILSLARKEIKEINGILFEDTLEDADLEKLQNIEAEILQAFDELQAIPEIFKHIVMWAIDVEGSNATEGLSDKLLSRIENIEGVLSENDPIAEKVIQICRASSFTDVDVGGGLGCWQVGLHLNENDATRLCSILQVELSQEIKANKIKITRKYTRPCLLGLLRDTEVEAFLKANPDI